MKKSRWNLLGAGCGIVDVLLSLIALLIVPLPPVVGSSVKEVLSYYRGRAIRALTDRLRRGCGRSKHIPRLPADLAGACCKGRDGRGECGRRCALRYDRVESHRKWYSRDPAGRFGLGRVGLLGLLLVVLLLLASAGLFLPAGLLAAGGIFTTLVFACFLLWELTLSIVLVTRVLATKRTETASGVA